MIHADSLVEALKKGEIAGAGLDVVSEYDPYLDAPNLIITQSRVYGGVCRPQSRHLGQDFNTLFR